MPTSLTTLIARARARLASFPMTAADTREQRISWAYGNVAVDRTDGRVTKELVRAESARLDGH